MQKFINFFIWIYLSLCLNRVENLELFEDFQSRDKEITNILKIIPRTTKHICALSCSLEQRCESFTFCKTRSCTLLSSEPSTHASNIKLSGGCANYGARKKVDKNLQLTTKAGFNEDTAATAIQVTQPPNNHCFPSSKGDGLRCIPFDDFTQWYNVSLTPMGWWQARHFCDSAREGVLMFSRNWSQESSANLFRVLAELYEGEIPEVWIGIRIDSTPGFFFDVNNHPIQNIPVENGSNLFTCFTVKNDSYLIHSHNCGTVFPFICELN